MSLQEIPALPALRLIWVKSKTFKEKDDVQEQSPELLLISRQETLM